MRSRSSWLPTHLLQSSAAAATPPRHPKRSRRRRTKRPRPRRRLPPPKQRQPVRLRPSRLRPPRRARSTSAWSRPEVAKCAGRSWTSPSVAASGTPATTRASTCSSSCGDAPLRDRGRCRQRLAGELRRLRCRRLDRSRARRSVGQQPLRSHDLRQPSGLGRSTTSRPVSSSASSARRAAPQPATFTSRSTSTVASSTRGPGCSRTPAEPDLITSEGRMLRHPSFDTPRAVHPPLRPRSSARALA